MSQFTTPAILEMLDNYRWRLVEPFRYYTEVDAGRYKRGVGVSQAPVGSLPAGTMYNQVTASGFVLMIDVSQF